MKKISQVLNQLDYSCTKKEIPFEKNHFEVFTTYKYSDESCKNIIAKYIVIDCYDIQFEVITKNFNHFQKEMISDDFYSHRDDIRWNIYVFLVVDNKNTISSEHFDIEKNEDYARKFIFDVCELEEFLKHGFLGHLNSYEQSQVKTNFILDWDNSLKELSLNGCIYNKMNLKSVEEYIQNEKPIRPIGRPSEKQTTSQVDDEIIISKVKRLHLSDYRTHCFNNNFVYSPSWVNLISGSNGSGKSSICDAIALGISGISKTNEMIKVHCDNSIGNEIVMSSDKTAQFCRNLDLTWYGTTTTGTKSRLNENFAIFNYLKPNDIYKSNSRDMNVLLQNIMYGEETTYAWKNIQNYKDKFNSQRKYIRDSLHELSSKIHDINGEIKSIDSTGSSNKLSISDKFGLFSSVSTAYPLQEQLNMLNSLEHSISVISNGIDQFSDVNIFRDVLQKEKDLDIKKKSIENKKFILEKHEKEIRNANKRILDIDEHINHKSKLNNELSKFYSEYKSINYEIIDSQKDRINYVSKYRQMKSTLNNLKTIMSEYACLEFCEDKYNPNIEDLVEKSTSSYQNLLNKYTEITNSIEKKQQNSSLSKKLLTDLFKYSMEFQTMHKDNKTCPLCGHDYEDSEAFIEAINCARTLSLNLDIDTERMMLQEQEIREKYKDAKLYLEKLEKELEKSNMIQMFIERLDEIGVRNESNVAMNIYKNCINLANSYEHYLNKNKITMDFLEEHTNSNYIYEYDNQSTHNSFLSFLANKKKNISDTISAEISAKNALQIKLGNLLKDLPDKEHINTLYDEILKNYKIIKNMIVNMNYIKSISNNIDDGFNIREWCNSFLSIKTYLDEILKRESKNELKVSLERKLEEYRDVFINAKARLNRCENALSAFDNLTSLEENMSHFITENASRIGKIFKMIHKPDEFTDLKIEDGSIKFIRKTTCDVIDINHISTGQALSLVFAVTICLHLSATNAPNLLIFDEPVANLDDVHIMNLVDILKEIALMGVQLFITTANDQVATYFRRKFSCLGNDFKHLEIQRTDEKPSIFIEKIYSPYKEGPEMQKRISSLQAI